MSNTEAQHQLDVERSRLVRYGDVNVGAERQMFERSDRLEREEQVRGARIVGRARSRSLFSAVRLVRPRSSRRTARLVRIARAAKVDSGDGDGPAPPRPALARGSSPASDAEAGR